MSLAKDWKKKETKAMITYESSDHLIYIWKRESYTVEAFKKGTGYKTRLFAREFKSLATAKKFVNMTLKQKRILKYQNYQPMYE